MIAAGSVPNVPKALADDIMDGNVVLFVGSGTSLAAGAPTWRGLMHRLRDEAQEQGIDLSEADDLPALLDGPPADLILAARYLRRRLGPRFGARIQREFAGLSPQPIHDVIAHLKLAGVVTTNYDCLLEETFPKWTRVVPPSSYMGLGQKQFVLKLHGSCQPEPDRVVIDPDDYRRVMADERLLALMRHLYNSYTFLFVGFGLRDPDTVATLEPLKELFGETARQHYALVDGKDVGFIRRQDVEKRLHVRLLTYTSPDESHNEAREFLIQLAELATRGDIARDVSRSLLVLGHRANGARSTRVLVKDASKDWEIDGERPYMLPNLPHTTDPAQLRRGVATQLGLPDDAFDLEIAGKLFETTNKNPSLGERAGLYCFQFVRVRLKSEIADLGSHFDTIGNRPAWWLTLSEIRDHALTRKLNIEPFHRLSDKFGSDLEYLD